LRRHELAAGLDLALMPLRYGERPDEPAGHAGTSQVAECGAGEPRLGGALVPKQCSGTRCFSWVAD
jgi:hypothetical protein